MRAIGPLRHLVMFAALLALVACDDHGKGGAAACIYMGAGHLLGEVFPAGDGCNSCMCTLRNEVTCTTDACDGGVDANPASCGASGGCPEGPACGTICCAQGEHCVNGACLCGTKAACETGDFCTSGPVGTDRCGILCCGVSGPCPQ